MKRDDVEALQMSEWQPIESAPKDGEIILLYRPWGREWGSYCTGHWESERYRGDKARPYWRMYIERLVGVRDMRECQPTHWMPLPNPPE